MPFLAMYDMIGIQDFIFSSHKMKENVGASNIVASVLRNFLPEAIKEICAGNCIVDWKEIPESNFQMPTNNSLQTEIIYIGGGNALVAYRDKATYKKVNEKLSEKMLKVFYNLKYMAACRETEFDDFQKDREELSNALKEKKENFIHTTPLLGIAITKEGKTDGYPASHRVIDNEIEEGDEFISSSAHFKRCSAKDDIFQEILLEHPQYAFPKELDELGQREGEDHIAFVHIDGNGMGEYIKNFLEASPEYSEAIPTLRKLSQNIARIYREAFKKVVKEFILAFEQDISIKNRDQTFKAFKLVSKEEKTYLPIRPLVLEGDDVTFACHGRLGIWLTEIFLKKIDQQTQLKINNQPLSACAGVAIVDSHFPFYRAYEIAESLCSSAKKKGRIISQNSKQPMASWMDFHISYGGITSDIEILREKNYIVPGISVPNPITDHTSKEGLSYAQYNLLWRPWCVSGNLETKYQWKEFKKIYQALMSWPRSRLKKLRNSYLKGREEIELRVREYESRGFTLPPFEDKVAPFFANNQTPYFDTLELLDFLYEPEEGKQK